jgi:nucleotide-binding universal stress UspA family protein
MSRILAFIDNSAASSPVLRMASAIAPRFGADVEAVHVQEEGDRTVRETASAAGVPLRVIEGDPLREVCGAMHAEDAVAGVIGVRDAAVGAGPAGHLALGLVASTDKPVVLVHPRSEPPAELTRVLVAVEGTAAKARRLERAVRLVQLADLELVVVHVDDESTIPSFGDQVQHETESYTNEFLARYVPGVQGARLELRIGEPVEEILDVARDADVQLLAIGWPHTDDPARGEVARRLIERSHVPILLVAYT